MARKIGVRLAAAGVALLVFTSISSFAAGAESDVPGQLKALTYSYGSFNGGQWDYAVSCESEADVDEDSPKCHFTAKGSNGVDMDVEGYFPQAIMDQLKSVIVAHGILQWDGFDERDEEILDGYGYKLTAEFENGILTASGYEKYPENYKTGHAFLTGVLYSWAVNGHFSTDVPDYTTVFPYYGRSAVEFAENFERDFPMAVSVTDLTVAGGLWTTSYDEALIREAFEALNGIQILEGRETAHTDDYVETMFTMTDGRAFTFSFQKGCFLMGGMQAEVSGYDRLDAARNMIFENGE